MNTNKIFILIMIAISSVCQPIQSTEIKQTTKQELVLIHGFLSHPVYMHFLEKNFTRQGYCVTNWGYSSRSETIEYHANKLVEKLNQLAAQKPGQPIYFLTHSLGGLILRKALNHEQCPKEAKIGRVVMLAPPNRGSLWGKTLNKYSLIKKIAGDYAGKQLMEKENFDFLGAMPSTCQVLVIAGKIGINPALPFPNDGTVSVDETHLSTPHKHVVISVGHKTIPLSKRAFVLAKDFLKQ